MKVDEITLYLRNHASDKFKQNVVKLGIPEEHTFGVPTPELRKLAKKLPKEKAFLIELWSTNYHECKILSVLALEPNECTEADINMLMDGIISWDLCDLFCKTILIKRPDFDQNITKWISSDQLFYKRAAFSLIASTSTHAALTIDEIKAYLELIANYSEDERLLVKKAASWALRELGKTSEASKELSVLTAKTMLKQASKAKQWVAKDALKELETLVAVSGRTRLISSKSAMGKQVNAISEK
ncbi:DNA alkylation repair protein [Vagococcus sp. BWB3-3]|uniref:DNA alkylation repair protein n=1 Tax=Vagococcus allomyrinae TaxID=2794353 RepID=A0A940P4J7_9ENTE|nr:DNA alkylation repair protein [Vagococcus allomyrinae]MBP1040910.1 DNA alkylation repair protein [Vagococcus allomyrinae]